MATTLLWIGLAAPAAAQPADDQTVAPVPSSIESEPPIPSALASIPASPSEAAVSTSPTALRKTVVTPPSALSPGEAAPELGIRGDGVALTRAAAQRRVETMSPIGWLSRYGAVRIAHPD